MIRERNIGIGLLGLGTIGAGVVEILAQKSASYEKNLGFSIELIKILVADANKTRDIQTNAKITADFLDLIDDPKIDLIVEAIGGETPAFEYIRKAIDSGKHVVTANKEVIAKYGPELIKHAVDNGVKMIMVGHIAMPGIDSSGVPATYSSIITEDIIYLYKI